MMLSKRLQCIADFVPAGSRVIDVGTDHAYIPIWLLQHGVCEQVIASDIKSGPLQTAKDHAANEGLGDTLRFVLAPGLDGCRSDEVDTVIIAGMGGETMIEILTAAPWAREKFLILQPQTKIPELRSWLNENGYDVTAAKLVYDTGRLYVVWCVTAGAARTLNSTDLLLDPALVAAKDPLLSTYIDQLVKKLRYKIQGMERASNSSKDELDDHRRTLQELLELRRRTRMPKVRELSALFNEHAPYYTKFDFDNVGLLVGFSEHEVQRVLTALDITDEVIEEAVALGADLIVSHHPLLFESIKKVTDDDEKGKKIIRMITNGISAICLHTNMDTADGGVNDALMASLGAELTGLLAPHGAHPDGRPYGVSRMGELPAPQDFFAFLSHCKNALASNGLRYHYAGKPVHKIACCGGAGGSDMKAAFFAGCDTYVTADLKYDHFLWAKEFGLNLIDADHFCTENVVVPIIADIITKRYPTLNVHISKVHHQVVQFY